MGGAEVRAGREGWGVDVVWRGKSDLLKRKHLFAHSRPLLTRPKREQKKGQTIERVPILAWGLERRRPNGTEGGASD